MAGEAKAVAAVARKARRRMGVVLSEADAEGRGARADRASHLAQARAPLAGAVGLVARAPCPAATLHPFTIQWDGAWMVMRWREHEK